MQICCLHVPVELVQHVPEAASLDSTILLGDVEESFLVGVDFLDMVHEVMDPFFEGLRHVVWVHRVITEPVQEVEVWLWVQLAAARAGEAVLGAQAFDLCGPAALVTPGGSELAAAQAHDGKEEGLEMQAALLDVFQLSMSSRELFPPIQNSSKGVVELELLGSSWRRKHLDEVVVVDTIAWFCPPLTTKALFEGRV